MPLISKDEQVKLSVVYVGSLILRCLENDKKKRSTLSELAQKLRKEGVVRYRPMTLAICFLYMAGTIDFREPYLYLVEGEL